jgi:hypothetical protein
MLALAINLVVGGAGRPLISSTTATVVGQFTLLDRA